MSCNILAVRDIEVKSAVSKMAKHMKIQFQPKDGLFWRVLQSHQVHIR